jgi:hypothetical protein
MGVDAIHARHGGTLLSRSPPLHGALSIRP